MPISLRAKLCSKQTYCIAYPSSTTRTTTYLPHFFESTVHYTNKEKNNGNYFRNYVGVCFNAVLFGATQHRTDSL